VYIYTRSGRDLQVTPQVISGLPNFVIDAEFWFGRGLYSDTFMLSKGSTGFIKWHFVRMIAFDEASTDMRSKRFEERYRSLLLTSPDHPFVKVAPRMLVMNDIHLQYFLQSVIEDGGEGAILRRINSLYEPGRSKLLVKLKVRQ